MLVTSGYLQVLRCVTTQHKPVIQTWARHNCLNLFSKLFLQIVIQEWNFLVVSHRLENLLLIPTSLSLSSVQHLFQLMCIFLNYQRMPKKFFLLMTPRLSHKIYLTNHSFLSLPSSWATSTPPAPLVIRHTNGPAKTLSHLIKHTCRHYVNFFNFHSFSRCVKSSVNGYTDGQQYLERDFRKIWKFFRLKVFNKNLLSLPINLYTYIHL